MNKSYTKDSTGLDFEQLNIEQSSDYEGAVCCTLIRKKCPKKSQKAVLYVHGFNDYFFQTEMADKFCSHGFNFYALDLRKYGRSYQKHQKFNNVRSLNEYYADIEAALNQIQNENHDFVLLSGHSTGGLILSLYAHDHKSTSLFHAFFANSPFFDYNSGFLLRKLGIPLISILGKKNPDKLMKTKLSTQYGHSLHESEKGEWNYDINLKPHIPPSVNHGFIRAIYKGHKKVHTGLEIDVPVLVMHSNKSIYAKKWSDEILKSDAVLKVEQIHNHALKIKGDVQISVIENAIHDIMLSQETVRKKAYKLLFDWLKTKTVQDI